MHKLKYITVLGMGEAKQALMKFGRAKGNKGSGDHSLENFGTFRLILTTNIHVTISA